MEVLVERDAPLHTGLAVLLAKENRAAFEVDIVPLQAAQLGQPDARVIQDRDGPEQEDRYRIVRVRLEESAEYLNLFPGTRLAPDSDATALPDQENWIFIQVFLPDGMIENGADMPVVGVERGGRAPGYD